MLLDLFRSTINVYISHDIRLFTVYKWTILTLQTRFVKMILGLNCDVSLANEATASHSAF